MQRSVNSPSSNALNQALLNSNEPPSTYSEDNSIESIPDAHHAEQPKASFANSWIKPGLATYVVATGMNIAAPHFFGQTIGRIPVVGEWTAGALKTVFTNTPVPVLDMLMTAGNMATYKNVKSFFSAEDENGITIGMKITNGVIFFGTAALAGYLTRMAFAAGGHTPEEGIMMPVAALVTPEQAGFIPEPYLKTLYLWNQNVSALTMAAQTIAAPVVERGLKAAAYKMGAYAKQRFFPTAPVSPTASLERDLENGAHHTPRVQPTA